MAEGISEHGLIGNALGAREACRQLLEGLFPPPRNKPPAHRYQLGRAVGGWPHDLYRVSRRNVVVGLQIASGAVREFVQILGKPKWRWFVQQTPEAGSARPIPPPNQGMADTLDDAKAAFAKRYEEVKRGK
jgi:hypothetical protein